MGEKIQDATQYFPVESTENFAAHGRKNLRCNAIFFRSSPPKISLRMGEMIKKINKNLEHKTKL